jgi:hypothetical protein
MVWTGGGGFTLAPAILTLLQQLQQAFPGDQWQHSAQTGTIGNAAHQAEGSASDHNPWLNNTVRALDVATNVSNVPGKDTVTDSPDCEAIFAMVNRMYAAEDPRVFPNGYTIFKARITDPSNPGEFQPYHGDDLHFFHVHVSVSQNPDGYNSTDPWPIGDDMPLTEDEWKRLQDMINNALLSQRAWLTANFGAVPQALSDFKPEIIGSTKRLRDTACALAGQLPTLPDGTTITSISVAHAEQLSAIGRVHAQLAGAGIDHDVRGGDPMLGGPDGQPVA